MALTLIVGRKGRFKLSRLEFEIVKPGPSITTIRLRGERHEHELKNDDLRAAADDIENWS